MKAKVLLPILLLLGFVSTQAYSQAKVGFKVSGGRYSFFSGKIDAIGQGAARLGVVGIIPFGQESESQFFLQGEANLSNVGAKLSYHMYGQDNISGITPLDVADYRLTMLNIPVSLGLKLNLNDEQALSFRAGLFLEVGLTGRVFLQKGSNATPIIYNAYTKGKTTQGQTDPYIFPFERITMGALCAVDYSINKNWIVGLELQQNITPGLMDNKIGGLNPVLRPYTFTVGATYLF